MEDSAFFSQKKNIDNIHALVEANLLREALDGFEDTLLEYDSVELIRKLNKLEHGMTWEGMDPEFYAKQRDRLKQLILDLAEKLENITREAYNWNKAKLRGQLKLFVDYLKEFPQGRHVEEALWEISSIENTWESYENYLNEYPAGKYASDAVAHMEALAEKPPTSPISFRLSNWRQVVSVDVIMVSGIVLGLTALFLLVRSSIFPAPTVDKRFAEQHVAVEIDSFMVPVGGGTYSLIDSVSAAEILIKLSPFEISRFEITQALWASVMGYNPSEFSGCPDCPVETISWYEAVVFCNQLSRQKGLEPVYLVDSSHVDVDNKHVYDKDKWSIQVRWEADGYRLPTEAEWDYVAQNRSFVLASNENSVYASDEAHPFPVGVYGLGKDQVGGLHSNVSEWVWDWFLPNRIPDILELPFTLQNPRGPHSGRTHVVKGGGTASEGRAEAAAFMKNGHLGIRVARTLFPHVEMVPVQGGPFLMGNDRNINERPVHEVYVPSFEIGKFEVSQALWEYVMQGQPSKHAGCKPCPVENVSWYEVKLFCNRLSVLHGLEPVYQLGTQHVGPDSAWEIEIQELDVPDLSKNGYRLPSEAEWEYAAKGGRLTEGYSYSGGNNLLEVGWMRENAVFPDSIREFSPLKVPIGPHPIGGLKSNELQVFDMTGNVWEWVEDDFESYQDRISLDSTAISQGEKVRKVIRGGGYLSNDNYSAVSVRIGRKPGEKQPVFGFRLARSLKE